MDSADGREGDFIIEAPHPLSHSWEETRNPAVLWHLLWATYSFGQLTLTKGNCRPNQKVPSSCRTAKARGEGAFGETDISYVTRSGQRRHCWGNKTCMISPNWTPGGWGSFSTWLLIQRGFHFLSWVGPLLEGGLKWDWALPQLSGLKHTKSQRKLKYEPGLEAMISRRYGGRWVVGVWGAEDDARIWSLKQYFQQIEKCLQSKCSKWSPKRRFWTI